MVEALRLADALADPDASLYAYQLAQAATELRRLSAVEAENETLKKSVARLQQHHATAWNRGHMMGVKTNEDTVRRALDAVKQDAWGNTQLTEALLKAEAQRDALLEVLKLARSIIGHPDDAHSQMIDAAIKAVEGEKA